MGDAGGAMRGSPVADLGTGPRLPMLQCKADSQNAIARLPMLQWTADSQNAVAIDFAVQGRQSECNCQCCRARQTVKMQLPLTDCESDIHKAVEGPLGGRGRP